MQSRCTRLRLRLYCWCTSEACKYRKRNHNGRHDVFLLNCNTDYKKQTSDRAVTASRFSHAFLQENFTLKWWFSFRVEAKNFAKNTLLNSTKIVFLFAVLNLNLIIQKKRQKSARFMDVLSKQGALNILILRHGCCLRPPIKISGYAPGRCGSFTVFKNINDIVWFEIHFQNCRILLQFRRNAVIQDSSKYAAYIIWIECICILVLQWYLRSGGRLNQLHAYEAQTFYHVIRPTSLPLHRQMHFCKCVTHVVLWPGLLLYVYCCNKSFYDNTIFASFC